MIGLVKAIYIFTVFGSKYAQSSKNTPAKDPLELEAWVRMKGLFEPLELEKNTTNKPGSYKIQNKIYPITLRQYFGDLHCKRTFSGSSLRCEDTKLNCRCIKKGFSTTGVSKACLYGHELTECRGTRFVNRDYTLESSEIFNDKNICEADPTWKYSDGVLGENLRTPLTDKNIDSYIDKKVRLGDIKVTKVLDTFGANPVRYIHSDLYYYNNTTRQNINDTPAQTFTDEKCWYFKTFEKRHGVDISSQCTGELETCNLRDEYKLCKFVKTRYYRYTNEQFEMNFEDFNLSNVYSVYLEEEGRSCGQAADQNPEIEKVKFLQVTILKEITLPPRRMFHLGPFGPYNQPKKLKVCACSSYTKTDKIYSCVRKGDYDIEIGEVVIRGRVRISKQLFLDKKTVRFQESDSGKPIKISIHDQIAFMAESSVIDEDCTKLFEVYKVDWKDYTVENLPSLSKYFVWGESNEDDRSVTFRADVAGKFCVCLVGKSDAMIETSDQGYTVKGVKNNIEAIAYKDSKGKRVVDGILVETVGVEAENIESIFVVDSKKSCDGEPVGEWSGTRYRYNTLSGSHEPKYLIYDEFRFSKDDAVLDENLICVKYTSSEGKYAVGVLSEREYKDYRIHTLNKPVDTDQVQPDDMYIFYATNNLEKFESWREQFKRLNERSRRGTHQVGAGLNSNEGFVDKYFKKMVHFEVYKGKNRISMSIANEEETLLLPIYDVQIDSPSKMRMVVTSKKVYWYVLMDTKRLLVRYDVDNIVEKYELGRDVVSNDIILYHPMDFEVLQHEDLVKIVLIDSSSSCIVMLDSELRHIKSTCDNIGNIALVNPLSITCSTSQKGSKIFNCFVVENTTDMIIWLSVDIGKEEFIYESNYLTGTVADDLDPHLGSISSIESYVYNDSRIDTTLLFIIRENPEFWAILLPDVRTKKIHFVTTLSNLPGYSRIRRICPTYNGPGEHRLMIIREHYINYPLKKGNDIQDIFERVRDKNNIKWVLTWAPLESILQIPEFSYNIPETVVYKDSLRLAPQFREYERFKKMITYHIGNYEDLDGYVKSTFAINGLTGELTINVEEIKVRRLKLTIIASILAVEDKIELDINFSCRDGEYYEGSACVQCPVGYYYSVSMNPRVGSDWPKCTKCPESKITRREGSSSLEDCTCDKGSTVVIDPVTSLEICEPCPPGTYKSTVGSEPCIGSCYKNSETKVIGSTSDEERRCECLPGYYWGGHDQGINECLECEKGYFCLGGFKSTKNKCPENMTSQPGANDPDKCVCMMGCEPVRERSQVSLIQKALGLRSKSDTFKCKQCPKNKYKDTESNESCIECPINSYSGENGSQKKSDCSKCKAGYYETGLEDEPCRKCKENMYCVGSDAKERINKKHEGKMERCPENSKSIEPFEMNVSMLNCLCVEGYVPVIDGSLLKCTQAPRDYYKDFVGNRDAIPCPNGSMTLSAGATSKDSCVCERGTYFDMVTQHCTICPAGKYCMGGTDDHMNHRQPMDCTDSNALTKMAGASSISECACKPGYYMDKDSNNVCTECPENHYKSYVSNDLCTKCDENSSTSGKKASTSKEQCVCDPGYYFDNGCVSCHFNDRYCPGGVIEIKDNKGAIRIVTQTPIKCPLNTEITPGVDNASSIKFCKCKKGYSFVSEDDVMNTKICAPCSPGTYKSSVMDSNCNGLCTQNATSLHGAVSSNQCFCRYGYYYLEGGVCSKCMEGAMCEGGLIDKSDTNGIGTDNNTDSVNEVVNLTDASNNMNNLIVDIDDHVKPIAIEGYYLDKINVNLRKSDDWKFIKCPIKGSCLGNDKCSSSMEHYLCSECKMGYTNNFVKGVLCQQCPNMFINISLTMVYGLGLLLINIVMACLNISAGFNRRSIHSVVIKIALNYAICTSVINVINFGELKIPMGLSKITNSFTKVFDSEDVVYYTSIDCLVRKLFKVNHADSLFYVTLYTAFLPIILLFVVTMLMWVILSIFKIRRYNDTRTKLALLQQAEIQGMHKISEGLREQHENERLLMIFRYIPLPNQTMWLKFRNFIEDMIPIYVTVLFSVHGKITSRMLSLLDCSYIDLGRSFPGKYMLRPAMSVKCSLYPSDGYIKYLILGLSGLVIWGFGIPFLSFTVLYTNRKNLYATSIRMKYGFLHNGFRQDYWYWETIVFTRKCLVLVIGSIVIVPSQNYSGSRIWMALVVAIIFLIVQLIYKPFDERDYFVLGRLENHSMIAWTFTLILFSIIIESNFNPLFNSLLLLVIVILNVLFVLEVSFFFIISFYSNAIFLINEHFSKANFTYIKASHILYSNQPFVSYDQTNEVITLKPRNKRLRLTKSEKNLTYDHLNYLVTSISNLYTIAVHELNLDVIPSMLIEFLVRYSISMANVENKILEKCLFNEFSGGNLSKLIVHVTTDNYNNLNKFINLKKYKKDNPSDHYVPAIQKKLFSFGFDDKEINAIVNSLFDDDFLINDLFLSDLFRSIEKLANLDKKALSLLYALFKHFKLYFERKESQEMEEKLKNLDKIKSELQMRRIDGSSGEELKLSVDKLTEEVNALRVKKAKYIEQLKELDSMETKFKRDHDNILLNVNTREEATKDNNEIRFGDMIQDLGFESHERSEFMTEVNPDDFE